jgi:uncharacterized protein
VPGKVLSPKLVDIDTPHGLARVHVHAARGPRAALVLGHGAGGGVAARDLQAVSRTALAERVSVALVEQPYRVAGRRSPAPAGQLDTAWRAVVSSLTAGRLRRLPLIVGGRSSGARVACRTAADTSAIAVLCLAFPLHPPGRARSGETPTRLPELDEVTVPTLVVQGVGDPFGMPPEAPNRSVVQVAGNHSLTSDLEAVSNAVRSWLAVLLEPAALASAG